MCRGLCPRQSDLGLVEIILTAAISLCSPWCQRGQYRHGPITERSFPPTWSANSAPIHAEGSLKADLWVLGRTLRILLGDVGQVVKGIRQSITKRGLSGARGKTLRGVADYLYRNRTRMRYDEYLANGWPIASGPVEGACKNLIKDRMERSGMRWTEQMAEAIVQLRAICLSGDFDQYWQFHIEQDQRRLYPAVWSVVPK